jgi:hypothetical protein
MGSFAWRPPFPEALRRKETMTKRFSSSRTFIFLFRRTAARPKVSRTGSRTSKADLERPKELRVRRGKRSMQRRTRSRCQLEASSSHWISCERRSSALILYHYFSFPPYLIPSDTLYRLHWSLAYGTANSEFASSPSVSRNESDDRKDYFVHYEFPCPAVPPLTVQ